MFNSSISGGVGESTEGSGDQRRGEAPNQQILETECIVVVVVVVLV